MVFKPEERYFSVYRIHDQHKSGVGGDPRLKELVSVFARHAGPRYGQLFSRCCSRRVGDQLEPQVDLAPQAIEVGSALLKTTFPSLFRGFKQNEVNDMMTML